MPINYRINATSRLIESEVSGIFSTSDTVGLFEDLLIELDAGGEWIEVVRFKEVSELRVRFDDIPRLAILSAQLRDLGLSAVLMCAFDEQTSDLLSGMRIFMQEVNLAIIVVGSETELQENLSTLTE